MSTTDTVTLLASGASRAVAGPGGLHRRAHRRSARELARALVADAEGATHDIAVTRDGRRRRRTPALAVARAVTRSNLFKAAMFGNDPNWGRVLAQVGTVPESVAAVRPRRSSTSRSTASRSARRAAPARTARQVDLAAHREVHVVIDLHAGDAAATVWTNDLTHDYVHENSAYST